MVTGLDAKSCNNNKAQTKPGKVTCALKLLKSTDRSWTMDHHTAEELYLTEETEAVL